MMLFQKEKTVKIIFFCYIYGQKIKRLKRPEKMQV